MAPSGATAAAAPIKRSSTHRRESPARAGLLFCLKNGFLRRAAPPAGMPAVEARSPVATTPIVTTPVAMAPVPTAPVPMAPTPMAPAPAPMPTTPAPVPVPIYFLRLETIDFIARGDSGMGIRAGREPSAPGHRLRHQRRGLNTGGECRGARSNAKCNLQEIPAFHDIFPRAGVMQGEVSLRRDEWSLNFAFRFWRTRCISLASP